VLRLPHGERLYRPVSRFPSSDIDLAFEVGDGTPAGAVAQVLRAAAGELLARLELFDVYRGPGIAPGGRSLAFTLRLQALDRTLTDAEVAEVRARCIAAVESALPARLRG
jgi:phenylalanyl-tRNA synthetase beta chain